MPITPDIDGLAYTFFMRDALEYFITLQPSKSIQNVNEYIVDISTTWERMKHTNRELYRRLALAQVTQDIDRRKQEQKKYVIEKIIQQIERNT